MEIKILTQSQVDCLNKPLPAEAVTPHPTKKFLSSIKSIYVTERLNEVFGVGRWRIKSEIIENTDKMIVVKAFFSVPEYGIEYECYGGNDNVDRGDAYKGAVTDAITKIGSWLGIGADVWKNKSGKQTAPSKPKSYTQTTSQPAQAQGKKPLSLEQVKANEEQFIYWLYNAYQVNPAMSAMEKIAEYYDADYATKAYLCDKFEQYLNGK
jgi:hypothetical protein